MVTRRHVGHFMGTARQAMHTLGRNERPGVKHWLHMYRALLTGIYLLWIGDLEPHPVYPQSGHGPGAFGLAADAPEGRKITGCDEPAWGAALPSGGRTADGSTGIGGLPFSPVPGARRAGHVEPPACPSRKATVLTIVAKDGGCTVVIWKPRTGKFPGRNEPRWLSRDLCYPSLAQWGMPGLSPVTEAKSRANAHDRRER